MAANSGIKVLGDLEVTTLDRLQRVYFQPFFDLIQEARNTYLKHWKNNEMQRGLLLLRAKRPVPHRGERRGAYVNRSSDGSGATSEGKWGDTFLHGRGVEGRPRKHATV
jgi:hypothetical protein